MRQIETWINEASAQLGISLKKLSADDAKRKTASIEQRYVAEPVRVWWLALRAPYVYYDSKVVCLSEVLPTRSGDVYFIPEEDDGSPLDVYVIEADNIETLIGECSYFEYYVVDIGYEWIVAETEHDLFLVAFSSDSSVRIMPGGKVVEKQPRLPD